MTQNNKYSISKKYNIPLNKLHDNHMQYYYTQYPKLCCTYKLSPIEYDINAFDYTSAIDYLNTYYKNIKSDYFRELLSIIKKYDNDITKCPIDKADQIIKEYIKFRKNTFCLTVWANYDHDLNDLVEFLAQYGYVYYVKEIKLNYNGAMNLVHQLYSDTHRFPTINKIKEKVEYLGWDNNDKNIKKKVRVIFFENASAELISGSQAPLKTKIREFLLKHITNKNLRGDDLMHINDHYYQTIEYSQIFLHKKTISFLKKQNLEKHLSFDKSRLYVNTVKQWIIKNVKLIDQERYVVMGSAILYLYGIRQCRDIDGLMLGDGASKELIENTAKFFYNRPTRFAFAEFGITDTKYWDEGWDIKDAHWFELMGIKYRDELLFNPECYMYFNGMKFLTLKSEILKKYIRHKYHDVGDMLQIMELLNMKIQLPDVQINDEFIEGLKTHLINRYDLKEDEINNLVKKYLK